MRPNFAETFVQDVEPKFLLDHLIQDRLVDDEGRQWVENGSSSQERARRLLALLSKYPVRRVLGPLNEALRWTKYDHVADIRK